MLDISGLVLDLYDDPKLSVLLDRYGQEGARAKFAFAVPERKDLEALDDDQFAAIFYSEKQAGQVVRRVWPVSDAASCHLSIEYFGKVASEGVLPDEVRNQIACNLLANAELFDVEVPKDMAKWASTHGDYIPSDNWVNVDIYESPSQKATKFAFERSTLSGVEKIFPIDTRRMVEDSVESFVKEGFDHFGMSQWDARLTASRLVKAATLHEVDVPDDLLALSMVEEKSAEEVRGAILDRIERLPVSWRDTAEKRAKFRSMVDEICGQPDPFKKVACLRDFDRAVGFPENYEATGVVRPEDVVFRAVKKIAREVPLIEQIGRDRISDLLGQEALIDFEKDAEAAFGALDEDVQEALRG